MQFREGDFIYVHSELHGVEKAMVTQFHRRGESELLLGVVHVQSGVLVSMKQTRIHASTKSLDKSEFGAKHVARRYFEPAGLDEMTFFKHVDESLFLARGKQKVPFIGKLETKSPSSSLFGIARFLVANDYIMHRRKNADLADVDLVHLLRDALKHRADGIWMNPLVSLAAIKSFGLPAAYFKTGRRLVPEYNQSIIHVDGSDSARTLGMHKDRDSSDADVNTILGCVAGHGGIGKEVIVWRPKTLDRMPKWWRNEGLGREAFALAKSQCTPDVYFHHIKPGQFLFMPKGVWHWVCPHSDAEWTVMVTSSFY